MRFVQGHNNLLSTTICRSVCINFVLSTVSFVSYILWPSFEKEKSTKECEGGEFLKRLALIIEMISIGFPLQRSYNWLFIFLDGFWLQFYYLIIISIFTNSLGTTCIACSCMWTICFDTASGDWCGRLHVFPVDFECIIKTAHEYVYLWY